MRLQTRFAIACNTQAGRTRRLNYRMWRTSARARRIAGAGGQTADVAAAHVLTSAMPSIVRTAGIDRVLEECVVRARPQKALRAPVSPNPTRSKVNFLSSPTLLTAPEIGTSVCDQDVLLDV